VPLIAAGAGPLTSFSFSLLFPLPWTSPKVVLCGRAAEGVPSEEASGSGGGLLGTEGGAAAMGASAAGRFEKPGGPCNTAGCLDLTVTWGRKPWLGYTSLEEFPKSQRQESRVAMQRFQHCILQHVAESINL
jgi:hypothetical protein